MNQSVSSGTRRWPTGSDGNAVIVQSAQNQLNADVRFGSDFACTPLPLLVQLRDQDRIQLLAVLSLARLNWNPDGPLG